MADLKPVKRERSSVNLKSPVLAIATFQKQSQTSASIQQFFASTKITNDAPKKASSLCQRHLPKQGKKNSIPNKTCSNGPSGSSQKKLRKVRLWRPLSVWRREEIKTEGGTTRSRNVSFTSSFNVRSIKASMALCPAATLIWRLNYKRPCDCTNTIIQKMRDLSGLETSRASNSKPLAAKAQPISQRATCRLSA